MPAGVRWDECIPHSPLPSLHPRRNTLRQAVRLSNREICIGESMSVIVTGSRASWRYMKLFIFYFFGVLKKEKILHNALVHAHARHKPLDAQARTRSCDSDLARLKQPIESVGKWTRLLVQNCFGIAFCGFHREVVPNSNSPPKGSHPSTVIKVLNHFLRFSCSIL